MSHILLSPLTLVVLGGVALWCSWHRLPRWGRIFGMLCWTVLLALCAPVGANLLVRLAESHALPGVRCEVPAGAPVVVLSGGFDRAPVSVDDHVALAPDTWRRLQAGIRFWRMHGDGPLVLVGGGPHAIREADVMADLAEAWGVPASAIGRERDSRTTWENAVGYAAMDGPRAEPAWLVTSALHLPRSLIAFRAAGVRVCGHASHSEYVPPGGVGYFIPQVSAIDKSQRALHELAGRAVYAYRARD